VVTLFVVHSCTHITESYYYYLGLLNLVKYLVIYVCIGLGFVVKFVRYTQPQTFTPLKNFVMSYLQTVFHVPFLLVCLTYLHTKLNICRFCKY